MPWCHVQPTQKFQLSRAEGEGGTGRAASLLSIANPFGTHEELMSWSKSDVMKNRQSNAPFLNISNQYEVALNQSDPNGVVVKKRGGGSTRTNHLFHPWPHVFPIVFLYVVKKERRKTFGLREKREISLWEKGKSEVPLYIQRS